METLCEPKSEERLKSFDLLAGVNCLKYDLNRYGQILPETFAQVKDEQLSYIAEGVDKASRTTFVFERSGDDLVYFDDGDRRPYTEMLDSGLKAALYDAALDPRREFLVDWARSDIANHEQNKLLKPGEKRVWVSAYPQDIEGRYGKAFLRSCGLVPERKMGYLYQATCLENGIVIQSQSVDRSDLDALSAALEFASANPSSDLAKVTEAYDQHLSYKYGGVFYAGRRNAERSENAWLEVVNNQDLVKYLMDGLVRLSAQDDSDEELLNSTKRLVYSVWAAFSRRLSGEAEVIRRRSNYDPLLHSLVIEHEVEEAFKHFSSIGKVMTGCGGTISIKGVSDLLDLDTEDAHSLIFSANKNKTEVLKCVHCPLCKRDGVDAKIVYLHKKKTITCSKCRGSKTYVT